MEVDIDHDVPNFGEEVSNWNGSYTWRVENWTTLTEEKLYSPEFEIGGYSWRLLVFPRGNEAHAAEDHISVYLDFTQVSFTPRKMYPKPTLELFAVKSPNPVDSMRAITTHTFSALTPTWGFPQFLPIQEALNLQNGYLVDDTLTFGVKINVEIDGILGMTSKAKTGFLGIKKLGKTSLLSSFLQCLFHIRMFRRDVYQIPTNESDNPQKSLPLALQHLFYKLQYQNTGAETKDVVRALNWNSVDMCLQHNVFTIQYALFAILSEQEQDRAPGVTDCASELSARECSSYVASSSLEDKQTTEHPFMQISLDALECKDVYASFDKPVQTVTSKEDTRNTETNCEAGVSIQHAVLDSLPTVLVCDLGRWHYCPDRAVMLKINSHYEFYDELDLDRNNGKLLSKNADRTSENKYRLHSVVVHAGSPNKGRYFTFIRCDEQWYKFDGEVINVATAEEAINAQFGDGNGQVGANFSKRFKSIDKSVAVTLVYIRKSEWARVMCEAGNQDLPEQIRDRFEEERVKKEKQQKQKNAHLFVNIKLATEFHFAEQIGKKHYFDLASFDSVKNYQIYKKTSFEHFKQMVWQDFEIPKDCQRFWLWNELTNNNTIRVSEPLIEEEQDLKTVLDLRHFRDNSSPFDMEQNALMTIKLFLEAPEKVSLDSDIPRQSLHPIRQNEMLIFIKYYDPESSKLSYLGHMFVEKDSQFRAIFENAKKMAGLGPKEEVTCFREGKHSSEAICSELVPNHTLEQNHLSQGDFIIIQKVAANSQCEFPTVTSLFDFVQNGRTITFRPLKNLRDEGFKLELSTTMSYDQVTNALAKRLQIDDPKRLKLTKHDIYSQMPADRTIMYNGMNSLELMIRCPRQYTDILYYEVMDMKLPYSESLKWLTIRFHNAKGALQSWHQIRLPSENRVIDLVRELKVELGEAYNDCDLRVVEMLFSRVYRVFDDETVMQKLYESHGIFRAEVIPEDQKNLKSDEFLVLFCHCKPSFGFVRLSGDPFWVKVKKGDKLKEVKVRIQMTVEVSIEEFSQWRIAYHSCPGHPVKYLSDEDEILARFPRKSAGQTYGKYVGDDESFIVLEH